MPPRSASSLSRKAPPAAAATAKRITPKGQTPVTKITTSKSKSKVPTPPISATPTPAPEESEVATTEDQVEEEEEQEEEDEDEDEDSSEEESSDGEPIVLLQAGREKRVNAGNRMRALLDEEIEAEEAFQEEEDDEEFEAKDEADVFDSDFGSTDEEAEGEEEDGEKRLEREAKAERRAASGKKKKTSHTPFLPTFARQTKQQQKLEASSTASTSATTLDGEPPVKRRKIATNLSAFGLAPRESSRKSAVEFKKTIEVRLKESEQRRLSLPKPAKKASVSLTQADLIAEALETEEINRASLLAFYAAEEDRRMADRIAGMRHEITGPKVSFLSRVEGDGVERIKGKAKEIVRENKSAAEKLESGRRRLIEVIGEAGKEGWRPNSGMGDPSALAALAKSNGKVAEALDSVANGVKEVSEAEGPKPIGGRSILNGLSNGIASIPSTSLSTSASPAPPMSSEVSTSTGNVRNYLVLENFEGTKVEEMKALFGDHHEWGTVKIVPSRSRVLHRKTPTCVITGLPALYRDPRTLSPFATIAAYNTLTSILSGAYSWNETLGAYTGLTGVGIESAIEASYSTRKVAKVKQPGVGRTSTPSTVASVKMEKKLSTPSSGAGGGGSATKQTPVIQENLYAQSWNSESKESRGDRARGRQSLSGSTPVATMSAGLNGVGEGGVGIRLNGNLNSNGNGNLGEGGVGLDTTTGVDGDVVMT